MKRATRRNRKKNKKGKNLNANELPNLNKKQLRKQLAEAEYREFEKRVVEQLKGRKPRFGSKIEFEGEVFFADADTPENLSKMIWKYSRTRYKTNPMYTTIEFFSGYEPN